jgi:hypothetical protein
MKRILLVAAGVLMTTQFAMSQKQTGLSNQDASSSATVRDLKRLDSQLDDAYIRGDKRLLERVLAHEVIGVSAEGDVTRKTEILSQTSISGAGLKIFHRGRGYSGLSIW